MIWGFIGVLLLVSFIWALLSARHELNHPHEIKKAKKKLLREKILFKL